MDNFCNVCVIIAIMIFMWIVFAMAQRLSGNTEAFEDQVLYEKNVTDFYGICSDGFGDMNSHDTKNQLNVLDMTILTRLAYEADEYDLCDVIDVYFEGDYKLIKIHREEPFYFHIRHKTAPIDIISIRGTDDLTEMLQDVSLFVEVVLYESLQWLVPFLNGLPTTFARQIIYYRLSHVCGCGSVLMCTVDMFEGSCCH